MSKLEVDAIEPQSGTTLTLGASGDAVNIASGASITDFKSTGIDDNATSTAITIDSSENVGIGTSNPLSKLEISTTGTTRVLLRNTNLDNNGEISSINWDDNADFLIQGRDSNAGFKANWYKITSTATDGYADEHIWYTGASTERMRIDSSGDVLVNCTSIPAAGTAGFGVEDLTANIRVKTSTTTTANYKHYEFFNPNGSVGGITTGGSGTSFNTSSDYRLKENVVELTGATDRLKQIPVYRFNFIADADTTVDGFLAHEVSSVVPEAITGIKDETETKKKVVVSSNDQVIAENIEQADWEAGKIADENGNTQYPTDSTWEATKVVPVYQGIDQAKLVPLLVKTIQELEARITALENA